MSIPAVGTRITIFSEEDLRPMWGSVIQEELPSAMWIEPTTAVWFAAVLEAAANNGTGYGGWRRSLCETDEGITWIRGWHHVSTPAAEALKAAWLLNRSAA